ncbi:glycerophosphodiester phosphodiesterase family protein [Hyphococcus luteus]|uniref:glycerophosphodiester phosphodiesterase n=1 Tax=Hyphococcus luteus TaxID=2058213 RepID=A0A2S7K7E1_9PROT|nr:glycerophosphodiester phosphodiesterase family protein [Marinicaulis flavus]PQA88434.1 glycerophosphodiester phosphodiesterase [Marinicaulis flavus]
MKAVFRSFALALAILAAACGGVHKTTMAPTGWNTLNGKPPLIIAHRGASAYRPEHTLAAYDLAIEQGADVIEPDLVFTKDGVLVARHDRYLSTTTDVADHPEFADRKKPNADPNDSPRDDWWVEDFTLAELKTLSAVQPFPGRSKEFDGRYEIPTFEEILALASRRAEQTGRPVGVYPETKHPGYFASTGMDFEQPLLAALDGFAAGPVFIQSFEPEILKRLKGKTDAKLVQLVYEETLGAGPNIPFTEIADYADAVGPSKNIILPHLNETTTFVTDAHALGLMVHPWTFRNDVANDNVGVSIMLMTTPVQKGKGAPREKLEKSAPSADSLEAGFEKAKINNEYELFFRAGVDGVFTDFPDTAVKARAEYLTEGE